MKNLENYGVQELNAMEIRSVDGGVYWQVLVAAAAVVGTVAMWAFDKGEELGRALAQN